MRGDVEDSRGDPRALDRFHGFRQTGSGSRRRWKLRVAARAKQAQRHSEQHAAYLSCSRAHCRFRLDVCGWLAFPSDASRFMAIASRQSPPLRRAIVFSPKSKSETPQRSEEHTSELQSPDHLVCRLLLEKKKRHRNSRARLLLTAARGRLLSGGA